MSDFNYQEYLKNNPLLQEEVKEEKLLTETEDKNVEEVMDIDRKGNKKPDVEMSKRAKAKADAKNMKEEEIPSSILTKINSNVVNVQTMAQAILDFIEQVQEKESIDFGANANMKVVLDRLNTLAKTEVKEPKAVAENEEVSEGFFDFLKKKEKEAPVVKDTPKLVGVDFDGNYIYSDDPNIGQKTYAPVYEEEVTEEKENEYAEKMSDKMRMKEETSSKMKVSELKAKIKEDIISLLNEEEEDEVEVDVEDEVEVDTEEPALDAADAQEGLSADEKEIQDSLKIAYDNAVAIGDTKLADQIGNSITFFTRTHVVER